MICNLNHLRYFVIGLLFTGCVSVQLPTSKSEKATGVKWVAPPSPFESINEPSIDQAWMSSKTSNAISFLSECNAKVDRSLEALQTDSLNVLSKMKIEEERSMNYNARRALWVTAQGEVDGVPVKMSVLTLKKNECNYTLTYSGLKKSFDLESDHFQKFLNSFEAP